MPQAFQAIFCWSIHLPVTSSYTKGLSHHHRYMPLDSTGALVTVENYAVQNSALYALNHATRVWGFRCQGHRGHRTAGCGGRELFVSFFKSNS